MASVDIRRHSWTPSTSLCRIARYGLQAYIRFKQELSQCICRLDFFATTFGFFLWTCPFFSMIFLSPDFLRKLRGFSKSFAYVGSVAKGNIG